MLPFLLYISPSFCHSTIILNQIIFYLIDEFEIPIFFAPKISIPDLHLYLCDFVLIPPTFFEWPFVFYL